MKRGLVLVGKDVDAILASYICKHPEFGMELELVVLRHRDLLEYRERFPEIKGIYSLPEYLRNHEPELNDLADSEIYQAVKDFEDRYQLRSSNRYVHYDFFRARPRSFTLRQNSLRNLLCMRFFESLNLPRYDFVMGEMSRSFYVMCRDMAVHLGIEYLSPVNIGILPAIAFSDDHFRLRNLEKKRSILLSDAKLYQEYLGKAAEAITAFRNRPVYHHAFLFPSLKIMKLFKDLLRKSRNLLGEWRALGIDKTYRVDYIYENPLRRVWNREVASKIKGAIYRRTEFSNKFNFNQDYIYFPLHAHPELTTSLFSEFIVDHTTQQATSCEFLSKVIPSGYKLVVKEHPYMVGTRERKFYKNFKGWFNIDFVSPEVSQFELIKNSKMVLTLCGTVGIEALIMGKPVITMADTYYHYFNQVRHVTEFAQLEKEIPEWIRDFKLDEDALREDIALLMFCIHSGAMYFLIEDDPRVISDENMSIFASAIQSELDLVEACQAVS